MRRRQFSVLVAPIALALNANLAPAASTWLGSDFSSPPTSYNSMANPANWSGGMPVSGPTLDLLFHSAFASSQTPNQNIASLLQVRSINATNTNNWQFNGSGYQFANATSNTLSLGNNNTWNAAIDFAGPTAITSGFSVNVNSLLTGTGPITVTGPSLQLNPTANSTYSGAATFTNSSLLANANAFVALSASSFTLNDASSINVTGNNRFGGSPAIIYNPAVNTPTVYINGSQSIGTQTFNGGGMLQIQNLTTLTGDIIVSSGAGTIYAYGGIDLAGGTRTLHAAAAADTLYISNEMNNGALLKTGAGKVTLGGFANSTFTAPVDVQAGTLLTGASYLQQGAINNGLLQIGVSGGTVNGPISGSGAVEILSGVSYAVANSYSGGTTLIGGTLTGTSATLHGAIVAVNGSVSVSEPAGSGNFNAVYSGTGDLQKFGPGRLVIGGTNAYTGTTYLFGGTLAVASDTAIGTGALFMSGLIEAVGTRTLANSLNGTIANGASGVAGSGNLTFTDASAKTFQQSFTHNSSGATIIPGKLTAQNGASVVVNAGTLSLGDASAVNGFVSAIGSTIAANTGGSLKLNALNFISLPDVTLNGGNLIVPNGYAIPLSAALQGNGSVVGRVASANGSSIVANGALGLGDAAHPAGVNLDGELYTNDFAVTLADSNQAVLGSLTRLGTAANDGSLTSGTGIVLNFGRNLIGRGDVLTGNTLAQASIINGDVSGDSAIFGGGALNFTGYVKGVGTFNNAYFSGTFAPGLSPALITVGSIGFSPMNILDMEIGGLNRGSQFDAIDVTGLLTLGGTLQISLINSFTPSIGDQFNFFDGSMTGTFSSFNFPALPVGVWDTSLLYSQGIVQVVVPEPTMLASLALAGSLVRRRRR